MWDNHEKSCLIYILNAWFISDFSWSIWGLIHYSNTISYASILSLHDIQIASYYDLSWYFIILILWFFMMFRLSHMLTLHDIQTVSYIDSFMTFRLPHMLISSWHFITLILWSFMTFRLSHSISLHDVWVVFEADFFMTFHHSCNIFLHDILLFMYEF